MIRYIGIDCGSKGGIACIGIEQDCIDIEVYPYSDERLQSCLQSWCFDETRCCLEEVHAMPKQGVSSTFTFGKNFGYILGALDAWRISYQLIKPQRWKKEFGLNSDKAKSIEVARRLFPDVSLKATERCKVDNDGMAESLLMACWAKRCM